MVARCATCRRVLMANGLCSMCADPAESVERLRKAAESQDIIKRQAMRKSSWWLRKAIERAKSDPQLPLSGQDAALPVGDR